MTTIVNGMSQSFDNVSEFLDWCDSAGPTTSRRSSQSNDNSSWYGGVNFKEAIALGRNGWPEGLEHAEKFNLLLQRIVAEYMFEPEVRYDVSGDWVDVGRYLAGEPEAFGYIEETEVERIGQPPSVVRIVMNVCVSGGVDPGVIIRRGAACAALVTALERHGRQCTIDIVAPNRGGGAMYGLTIRAKEAGEPMELDKVIFLTAHPAILRRLIFSAWEHDTDRRSPANMGGYGMVGEMPADERGDIYLGGADLYRGAWTMDTAEKWIIDTLREQGVAIKEEEAA